MKIEDVKVGMRVIYSYAGDTDVGVVTDIDEDDGVIWTMWEGSGFKQYCPADYLSPVVTEVSVFSLSNTKINVQKYADDNGLTLKQAHEEIQPWLFEQGCSWYPLQSASVKYSHIPYLFVDGENRISYCDNDPRFFFEQSEKEITLQRTVAVTLTPSFVESPAQDATEYVELGGRKYVKKELEEVLSKIKAVE